MSMRAKAGAFLSGFGVAAGLAMYYVQQDVGASHAILVKQTAGFEERLRKVEAAVADQ